MLRKLRRAAGWLCATIFARPTPREIFGYGMFALGVAVVGYYAIIDRQPILKSESAIITPVVKQGGEFSISYEIDWSSTCRVTGYRVIIDGAGIQYDIDPDSRMVQSGSDRFFINIPIPMAASPGTAIYRGEVEYMCNWFQRLFPLKRPINPREFIIEPAARRSPMLWQDGSVIACPEERPVYVSAYCRSTPSMVAIGD